MTETSSNALISQISFFIESIKFHEVKESLKIIYSCQWFATDRDTFS